MPSLWGVFQTLQGEGKQAYTYHQPKVGKYAKWQFSKGEAKETQKSMRCRKIKSWLGFENQKTRKSQVNMLKTNL